MAKCVGNIALLREALERWGRDALILFFVAGHYRQPLRFSDETLAQAQAGVQRLREAGAPARRRRLAGRPGAPSRALLRRAGRRLQHAAARSPTVCEWVARGQPTRERRRRRRPARDARRARARRPARRRRRRAGPDEAALELLDAREAARAARDFAEADRLRDELAALGWEVRDGAGGADAGRGVEPRVIL